MKEYENFNRAREFARNLKISSASEWRKYASSGERPSTIPSHPDRQYKNNGWKSWMDWLDTNNKQCSNRKYKVNDNYFKKWSEDMSYILGFWFTDGYMHEKLGTFSITQCQDDKYLLENILKKMDSNYPLGRHGENNYVFKITSHEILKDIKKYGGHQRKSHNIKFPTMIPKKYLPDFIRGLWDGDGCICWQKKEKCYVSSFVSASKCFVYDLLGILRREILDFKGTIGFYNNVYVLSVGVNDTRRLRDYLYGNINDKSLFLKRKCNKFKLSGDIRVASFNKKFLAYERAQKIIQKIGIKRYREWRKYRSENKINNIPSCPENTYKNKGWVDWETFAGTKFWDFMSAKNYVRSLGLENSDEWKKYASGGKRISNIPSNPWTFYKEWRGLDDWLGKNKS